MAASVEILCLNGRRQIVKVVPQTSILQILEEVCIRQNIIPEEHSLKHGRTILDVGVLYRYSGLPNNAKLELVKNEKPRKESQVMLAIQLEDGSRVQSYFNPNVSLWQILVFWNEDSSSPKKNRILPVTSSLHPVCVYMREEFVGEQVLKATTLRSLGLMGGSAVLRLVFRELSQTVLDKVNESLLKEQEKMDLLRAKALSEQINTDSEPWHSLVVPPTVNITSMEIDNIPHSVQQQIPSKMKPKKQPPPVQAPPAVSFSDFKFPEESKGKSLYNPNLSNSEIVEANNKEFNREVVVYNLNDISCRKEELPDEFFEVTVDDVRKQMVYLQQTRADLMDKQLLTKAMREAQEQVRMLKYEYLIIRVQFPDRYVLQGRFKPMEKVLTIKNFICEHLQNPKISFYLFTTPPHQVLQDDHTLMQARLIPASLVHFGTNVKQDHFLQKNFIQLPSTIEAANKAAQLKVKEVPPAVAIAHAMRTMQDFSESPKSSQQQPLSSKDQGSTSKSGSTSDKVPKWFRVGKNQ